LELGLVGFDFSDQKWMNGVWSVRSAQVIDWLASKICSFFFLIIVKYDAMEEA